SNLASVLAKMRRLEEAEAEYQAALKIVRQLTTEVPDDLRYRGILAEMLFNVGAFLVDEMTPPRFRQAEAVYREARTMLQQLTADYPKVSIHQDWLARVTMNLATLMAREGGRFREAEEAYSEARTIRERLVTDTPGVPEYRELLAQCRMEMAELLKLM